MPDGILLIDTNFDQKWWFCNYFIFHNVVISKAWFLKLCNK